VKQNKPKSGVQAGASPAVPPVDLNAGDDLMDELLAAQSLPPSEQHLPAATLGSSRSHHEETIATRMGKVVGLGVVGAIAMVILLMFLIWLSVNL
jgi:hypothetical protein